MNQDVPSARCSRSARRRSAAVAILVAELACGCAPGSLRAEGTPVVLPGGGAIDVEAVLAGDGTSPWLAAGATISVDRGRQVAVWTAPSPAGLWARASTAAVSGDGPQDTITGLARDGSVTVAFGSRSSPIHGIPRPSPWVAVNRAATSWQEVPTRRELFGGENVVAIGGLAGGPHGFTVAGTWSNKADRPVATVWRSGDGRSWQRDDADPSLTGARGQFTAALDVADGPTGLAAVGSVLTVSPANPYAERGALWESRDGSVWDHVGDEDGRLGRPGEQVRVDLVAALGGGWIATGSRTTPGSSALMVWSWGPRGRPAATALAAAGPVHATALAVSDTAVVVGGVAGGRPVLWEARTSGGLRVGRWRRVALPSQPRVGGATRVLVAARGPSVLLVVGTSAGSWLWSVRLR